MKTLVGLMLALAACLPTLAQQRPGDPPPAPVPYPGQQEVPEARRPRREPVPEPAPAPAQASPFYDTVSYHCRLNERDIRGLWVQERVNAGVADGPQRMHNYPWHVHQGHRYRYSRSETCRYELVDTTRAKAPVVFHGTCEQAYDSCAQERDRANSGASTRFFCGERLETWFGPTRCP